MNINIKTSQKFRRINIEIDGKDYTNIFHKRAKQNIVWGIKKELLNLDKIIEKLIEDMPEIPSNIVIAPNPVNCDQCTAFLHNCSKYMRFLTGNIEVCSVLYDLILEQHLLNAKPIIEKELNNK